MKLSRAYSTKRFVQNSVLALTLIALVALAGLAIINLTKDNYANASGEITAFADTGAAFDSVTSDNFGQAKYGTDPVWGNNYYRYKDDGDSVVNSEAELRAAITAAAANGTYEANKPYIIPISQGFNLTSAISITTAENLVLRKVEILAEQPTGPDISYYKAGSGKWILQKYWNYTSDYPNKNNSNISPDMYDGESDFFIGITTNDRHFNIVATNFTLTFENITLDGGGTWDYTHSSFPSTSINKGGIDANIANFTFAGNIFNSNANDGGAIKLRRDGNITDIRGGVFHHNRADNSQGGAICELWNNNNRYNLTVENNTIFEYNFAKNYGGAIAMHHAGNVVFKDNVVVRNNYSDAGGGGGIQAHEAELTIKDNVLITGNEAGTLTGIKGGINTYPATGGGVLLTSSSRASHATISGDVVISNNVAMRGGGGFTLGTGALPETTVATLTLNGGHFINNKALGTYRELDAGHPKRDEYSVGGGGGIYAYYAQNVIIPANSTVYFEGNSAPFVAYQENTALQNKTTGNEYYANDDYFSHIENSNVHTSLVNERGSAGADYYNLYNNYDIGTPNNLEKNLYALVDMQVNPISGIGGDVTRSAQNKVYDLFQDGRVWAEVGTTLTYTANPANDWVYTNMTATSSVNPLVSEFTSFFNGASNSTNANHTASWTNQSTVNIKIQPWDVKIIAGFEKDANLTLSSQNFSTLILNEEQQANDLTDVEWFATKPLVVANEAGGRAASISKIEFTGSDASFFSLTGSQSATIAAGVTDNTSWTIRPNQTAVAGVSFSLGEQRTFTANVVVTYNSGKTASAPVVFTILKTPTFVIESQHNFGTVIKGSNAQSQNLDIYNYGVTNSEITSVKFYEDDSNSPSITEINDFEVAITGSNTIATTNPASHITNWQIRPKATANKVDLNAGTYIAWAKVTYTGDNLGVDKQVFVKVQVKVIDPALLTWTEDFLASGEPLTIDFNAGGAVFPERYPIVPAMVGLRVQNSGDVPAEITDVTLSGANSDDFTIIDRQTGVFVNQADKSDIENPIFGRNSTMSVAPKLRLLQGEYNAIITFSYNNGLGEIKTLSVNVKFVVGVANGWSFNTAPTTYTFPSRAEGYAGNAPEPIYATHDISIRNTGNQATGVVKAELLGDTDNAFIVELATLENIAIGASNTIAIGVKSGLLASNDAPHRKTYTATLKVYFDLTGIPNANPSDFYSEYSQKATSYKLVPVSFTVYRKAEKPNLVIDYINETFSGWVPGASYSIDIVVSGHVKTTVNFTMPEGVTSLPLNAVFEKISAQTTYQIRNYDTGEVTCISGSTAGSDCVPMQFTLSQVGAMLALAKVSARMADNGEELHITRLANSGEANQNSEVQILSIPKRSAEPSNIIGQNETIASVNDGKINGTTNAMEYAGPLTSTQINAINIDHTKFSKLTWTDCAGTSVPDLAAGYYYVRSRAVEDTSFHTYSVLVQIGAGDEQIKRITVHNLTIPRLTYGYTPSADGTALTISSSGNANATISNLELDSSTAFEIDTSSANSTVTAGGTNTTYKIKVKAGLDAGTYTATITATYDGGDVTTASGTISVIVDPKPISLSLTNMTFSDKVYDGDTTVVIQGAPEFDGVLPDDIDGVELIDNTVTWEFVSPNAHTNAIVKNGVYGLSGAKSANYIRQYLPAEYYDIAKITPRPIEISEAHVKSKSYDGNTHAELEDITFEKSALTRDLFKFVPLGGPALDFEKDIDFRVLSVEFEDPQVGANKTVNILVELTDSTKGTNHLLAQGSFTTLADITEASGAPIAPNPGGTCPAGYELRASENLCYPQPLASAPIAETGIPAQIALWMLLSLLFSAMAIKKTNVISTVRMNIPPRDGRDTLCGSGWGVG